MGMDRSTENLPTILSARLICWLGPLVALFLAFQVELLRTESDFEEAFQQAVRQVEAKADTFEVALEGFASFLAVSGDISDDEIRTYVRSVRELYSDLYMFEITSRVEHHQRDSFEQSMRERGYPDFHIHGYDFRGSQQVVPVTERPVYYPVRFMEPEPEGGNAVLGLDIGSTSPVVLEAMMRSLKLKRPVASRPFPMIEGGKGYILYSPVIIPTDNHSQESGTGPLSFAMLVVRASDLLPEWLQDQDSYTVSLSYRQTTTDSHREILIEPVSRENANLLSGIVGQYSHSVELSSPSQPFELFLSRSVRWADLTPWRFLMVFLSGTLLSVYGGHRLIRTGQQRASAREAQARLYHRANFDPLTDLPNASLLADRAGQAIRIAERSGSRVALCYLDIDRFKAINDSWGHEAGDELLTEIAGRLRAVLRDEDTAARIHGDEFIVLLPEVSSPRAPERISDRIASVFDQPFTIAGRQVRVRGSIGTALYPDDAENLEALLNISDRRMYAQKHLTETSTPATGDPATSVIIPEPENSRRTAV